MENWPKKYEHWNIKYRYFDKVGLHILNHTMWHKVSGRCQIIGKYLTDRKQYKWEDNVKK